MWDCLRRHRNKLLFFGGAVGGLALLHSYLKRRVSEWERQKTEDICGQLKRSAHFESSIRTCDSGLVSFGPRVTEIVCETVKIEPIVEMLQSNPPNKLQLWEQLKILVFTQAVGEMLAQCLLCILMKVQMSILSGYMYASCITSDTEQQQKYLSSIEDFMVNGIPKVIECVRQIVEEHLKTVPLNRTVSLNNIMDILNKIKFQLIADHLPELISKSTAFPGASSNSQFLDRIHLETRDVLECKDFSHVLASCLDLGISSVVDRFSECYVVLGESLNNGFVNPHHFSTPLAKLIPLMHNACCQKKLSAHGTLMHVLIQQDQLNNFAANIYEAFSQSST